MGEVPLRHPLTDEDIQAVNYYASLVNRSGDFRLGQYEPDNTIEDLLMRSSYEIGEHSMLIDDVVWGKEYVGDQEYDQLLAELARTPLFRRMQSIEQLTLGPEYATMPNSMYFSRWEHIWGSLVFVRKMTEGRQDIDDRQKMALQLRTLLSDVGHTAFSHLGDWIFQEVGGSEDQHDKELKDILNVSGIADLLEKYGFAVDEVVFPAVKDWVECPSPDLCVDRVDYGMREILRWVAPSIPMNMELQKLHSPQLVFEITEKGELIFKDPKLARYFAAGFSILPTEHWSQPPHRLQLQLFQSAVKASVAEKIEIDGTHPRDAMYGIDRDFYAYFHTWPMLYLHKTMKDIASTQRQIFIQGRRADLLHTFVGIQDDNWKFPDFLDPIQPYTFQSRGFLKPYPPNVEITESSDPVKPNISYDDRGLVVGLPPLKPRSVDPKMCVDGSVRQLSEVEPSFRLYLAGQHRVMARSYIAKVLMREDVAKSIVEECTQADELWANLLKRSRSAENLARIIKDGEVLAAVSSFDSIYESDDDGIRKRSARR